MENENISSPLDHMAGGGKSDLVISSETISYLSEAGKWSKFIAIMGFVLVGFMVLVGLFSGTIFSALGQQSGMPLPGFAFGLIYVVLGAIYFVPLLYLFNFSTKIRSAVSSGNNYELNEAFKNLKSHYKYIGILMIILISIYIMIFLGAIAFGAFSGF